MTEIKQYRKRPVVIEAERVDRDKLHRLSPEFRAAVCHGVCDKGERKYDNGYAMPHVHTLEGAMHLSDGDWLIKGVKGEFYPCKPDIFEATYEAAEVAPAEIVATASAPLPQWEDMTDLDRGAALLHIHKRDYEGREYAIENYPARYFDHPALTALGPREASEHAISLEADADTLLSGDCERLYDLALDADRAR